MAFAFTKGHLMSERYEHVCRVRTAQGEQDYVTLLPPETVLAEGLAPEAIVGVLSRPLGTDERITPALFARNRAFVDFLHDVIARHAPEQPGLQAEARRLGNGWVYIIDRRTRTPGGPVPPEDVLGALEVKQGVVVPGSYRRSPKHQILSPDGFFRLDDGLHASLMRELAARNAEARRSG
jgi:hypothetical protein